MVLEVTGSIPVSHPFSRKRPGEVLASAGSFALMSRIANFGHLKNATRFLVGDRR